MRIKSMKSLKSAAKKARDQRGRIKTEVLVCAGTGCLANGSLDVAESLERAIRKEAYEQAARLRDELKSLQKR